MADADKLKEADKAAHEEALSRFRTAADAENDRRVRQLADYKFSIGRYGPNPGDTYQWDENDKTFRAGRP